MASKNFYLNLVIRSLTILIASLLSGWVTFYLQLYILGIFFFFIAISSTIGLVRYLNKTNEKIAFFLEAVRNEDSSLYFPEYGGNKTINELNKSLNSLNKYLQNAKIELRQQEQYFQAILENISTGIITVNKNGSIINANAAVKKLMNYEHLTHIKQLERIDKELYLTIKNIQPGDRKLFHLKTNKGDVQLSLKSTNFIKTDNQFQLIAIQDIKTEIEQTELDSWIKLIRVLTHEIMNTIAPITSFSETLLGYFKDKENKIPSERTIHSTIKGLEVINERGRGLIDFVDSYRKLTRLPRPEKKVIRLKDLFERIIPLMSNDYEAENIEIKAVINPENLEIFADEKQIIQVLINLCRNSIHALDANEKGLVILKGILSEDGRPQIVVSDNGCGIPEENLDKIFIPFFTTKESGSGVGLSLSRQIMQMHGGTLTAISSPGQETFLIMTF